MAPCSLFEWRPRHAKLCRVSPTIHRWVCWLTAEVLTPCVVVWLVCLRSVFTRWQISWFYYVFVPNVVFILRTLINVIRTYGKWLLLLFVTSLFQWEFSLTSAISVVFFNVVACYQARGSSVSRYFTQAKTSTPLVRPRLCCWFEVQFSLALVLFLPVFAISWVCVYVCVTKVCVCDFHCLWSYSIAVTMLYFWVCDPV